MAVNKALLRRLARKLRRIRHEEHYRQSTIVAKTTCGTAACIGGHTVLEAGYKLPRGEQYPDDCIGPSGRKRNILATAEKLLGLSRKRANRLFTHNPAGMTGAWEDDFTSPTCWPEEFVKRWNTKERKSRIAADLLDAVADTDGKILA